MSSVKKYRKEQTNLLKAFRVPFDLQSESVRSVLSTLDTPRSLAVWLLYENKEHQQLIDLEIRPENYLSVESFKDDYLATNLLSKAEFLQLGFDRREVALKKFLEFEELCGRTNNRFRFGGFDPLYKGSNVWLYHALRRKISRILGDFSVEEMLNYADWGPGVTTLIKGHYATSVSKFQNETGITRDLHSLLGNQFGSTNLPYPGWWLHLHKNGEWPNYQVGSVTVTVAKTAKTDRVISVEPGINLWFQKGIGSMIRRRLRKAGVDLNDQEKNQKLSQKAFSKGLATVDFSSASDSISKELVRSIIPSDWLDWMDACRSQFGELDKRSFCWEKYSSMGNGFTFELESLIFFCASLVVCEYLQITSEDVSVYGDDVIIPSRAYSLFSDFSEFLGFRVNLEKSFSSGPFRESCGAHWFAGFDVKPFFMKKRLRDAFSVFTLANQIRRFSRLSYGCDKRWMRAFYTLTKSLPKPIRFKVDFSSGDVGFTSNFDEALPTLVRAIDEHEGYHQLAGVRLPVKVESDGVGLLQARLRHSSEKMYRNSVPLRDRTTCGVIRILVHQWCDLGPWI